MRILVVEDDRAVREAVRRALALGGYEVQTAEDGEQAIELAVQSVPDAVVLDIGLPGVDGLEVCRPTAPASCPGLGSGLQSCARPPKPIVATSRPRMRLTEAHACESALERLTRRLWRFLHRPEISLPRRRGEPSRIGRKLLNIDLTSPMHMARATFYFDLGSPFAYLAAERLCDVLSDPVEWQPVSLGGLFKANGRSSWAVGDQDDRRSGMAEVERRADLCGLPPVRWPDPWPSNYLMAMRAATFAYEAGCGHEFTMQGFRAAFQGGLDLGVPANVLEVAQAIGLSPREVEQATEDPAIKLALREATDAAHALGVFGVPTVAVDQELFWGEDRLEDAAAHFEEAGAEEAGAD